MAAEIKMFAPNFFSGRAGHEQYAPIVSVPALFAVITYVAVSTRAVLSPYEVHYFLDTKRILSVLVGAWILWFAMRAAERVRIQGPGHQISAVLRVSIPGIISLFLIREAYDLAASGEIAQRLGLNIRWMLTWIGYFLAAVAAFFALSYHRQLSQIRDGAALHSRPSSNDIDERDRQELGTLLMVLRAQTGYETADVDIGNDAQTNQERQRTVDRLLNTFELNRAS